MGKVYVESLDRTFFHFGRDEHDDLQCVGVLHGTLKRDDCGPRVYEYYKNSVYANPDGFQIVTVVYPDGEEREAVIYTWETPSSIQWSHNDLYGIDGPVYGKKGTVCSIVCALADALANEEAIKMYNARYPYVET